MKQRIVTITDCVDAAANELRGVLATELDRIDASDDVVIEPFVSVQPFSIVNGAFLLRLMAEVYSAEATTFLVVVNPLSSNHVGRARIAGRTANGFRFVGANTGVFGWLLRDFPLLEIRDFDRTGLDGVTFVTFGGKVFHAPVAARFAAGRLDLEQIGTCFEPDLLLPNPVEMGTVVHIDNFGVPKVYGDLSGLGDGREVDILVNGKSVCTATVTTAMKNLPDGSWALYKGSSLGGLPELARVRHLNTSQELRIHIGDTLTWK